MRIEWRISAPTHWQAEALLFFVPEKTPQPPEGLDQWIRRDAQWLAQSPALRDFQGKIQQVAVFYDPGDGPVPRVLCCGLGPPEDFHPERLRMAAAAGLRKCRELRLKEAALPLSAFAGLPCEAAVALEEAVLGAVTGLHQYDALKTRDVEPTSFPETLCLLAEREPEPAVRQAPFLAEAVSSGILLARDLTVAPANEITPSYLAGTARRLAEAYGFTLDVIDLETAREMGMGAFAAVAQGSREPPAFIVLEHKSLETGFKKPLVVVGKGITFDTGGISLKPGDKLDSMKQDMAGAAAVLGLFEVLGKTRWERHVVGILPCTENMPGGRAYKPGDVLRTLAGLTVEVISTDAEGRLVLCDALAYARRYSPALILDIATLTGACIVALGKQVAGIMGNRESLVQRIQQVGMDIGERLWPLPLWDLYFDSIKSDVADIKNLSDRAAAAIIGGVFLNQFVPREIPWIHLDIAGTAWSDKETGAFPKGPTGFGVRLFFELLRRWEELGLE